MVAGSRDLEDTVDGHARTARLVIPDGDDAPRPLAIVIHGSKGQPQTMIDDHGWGQTLARAGWVGVFPATGHSAERTQDGRGDTPFLLRLLDRVPDEVNVDRSRIYLVGFSGGARSAYLLAAQHSARITALAAHSGVVAMAEDPVELSDPRRAGARPISVLHVHGGRDPKIPPQGGTIRAQDGTVRHALPTDEGLARWVELMGGTEASGGASGGPERLKVRRWKAPSGHGVQRVIDPDLGHEWAGDWVNEMIIRFFEAAPRL